MGALIQSGGKKRHEKNMFSPRAGHVMPLAKALIHPIFRVHIH
jgi:hypothetical protein